MLGVTQENLGAHPVSHVHFCGYFFPVSLYILGGPLGQCDYSRLWDFVLTGEQHLYEHRVFAKDGVHSPGVLGILFNGVRRNAVFLGQAQRGGISYGMILLGELGWIEKPVWQAIKISISSIQIPVYQLTVYSNGLLRLKALAN